MMQADELETYEDAEMSDAQPRAGGFNLGALVPGGEPPGAEELSVAGIILGAILFVFLMRRGFASVLNK